MAEPDVTQIGLDIFSEFLEVAIHSILYDRELYPAGVFERRKKYNVPVQICVHPEVNRYITQVVNGISEFNTKGQLEKVAIVICNSDSQPVEKFILEINKPSIPQQQTDRYLYQLEQSLRSFLLKINMADSLLKPLPPDCTWTVHATTRESAAARMFDKNVEEDFPWLEASEQETMMENSSILPLKSTTSPYLNMQMYVEETKDIKGS
ncbi:mitotic spindle assembly checkpoint protein MAD2B-like isoform X3 [Saccostrea echinata]|uniref:mitotic spindle assembly checkpoint protein MAD2B-like isoform X3 n=1 Tax=Saccostrea echinata TaxID=191078 RepID=UPI002A812F46|nr:mitotic spindle assembly checkpoint protein MAD2B-like isoform X3 [Saccostrea echinata]